MTSSQRDCASPLSDVGSLTGQLHQLDVQSFPSHYSSQVQGYQSPSLFNHGSSSSQADPYYRPFYVPPLSPPAHAYASRYSSVPYNGSSNGYRQHSNYQHLSQSSHSVDLPSGIQALPVELLYEIFLFATSSPKNRSSYSHAECPLSLTHTCRLWRELAVNSPALWNCIGLFHGPYSPKLLELVLSHSKNWPLFIELNGLWGPIQGGGSIKNIECVELLLDHASRWQELRVDGQFFANPSLQAIGQVALPNLRHVTWTHLGDREGRGIFNNFWDVAGTAAPSLEIVELRGHMPPRMSWLQLRKLRLQNISADSCCLALRQCTNLTSLTWLLKRATSLDSPVSIVLPHLTELRLNFRCDNSDNLFNSLVVPRLNYLDVTSDGRAPLDVIALEDMLTRSDCQLRTFILRGGHIFTKSTVTSLLLHPSFADVTQLRFPGAASSAATWRLLQSDDRLILSRLTFLQIGITPDCPAASIVSSLRSRCAKEISIPTVCINVHPIDSELRWKGRGRLLRWPQVTEPLKDLAGISICDYDPIYT